MDRSGMKQAGLAECIERAVNSCHPHLHPVLCESIILTGGSTMFPRFAERLERELRSLVPDEFRVKITTQEKNKYTSQTLALTVLTTGAVVLLIQQ